MSTIEQLRSIIAGGENSEVEFKRDVLSPNDLARVLVAFANTDGGKVFLGVEDEGKIGGLVRIGIRDWVTTICRENIRPSIKPEVEIIENFEDGKSVAVVSVSQSKDVQSVWRNGKDEYYIRVGAQVRYPSKEELAGLFQRRKMVHGEKVVVPDTSMTDLDYRRLQDYFRRIKGLEVPPFEEAEVWSRSLQNIGVLTNNEATTAGLLLFGTLPNQHLPQAGIQATKLSGDEMDYDIVEQSRLRGPMVPLMGENGEVIEAGLVEQALKFVERHTASAQVLVDGLRREKRPTYPEHAVRESIVNALIHRDYLIIHTDIMLNIYSNRIEIVSPGRLPNGINTKNIRSGERYHRNEILAEIMGYYGYVESMGMGVPYKIIRGMLEHNGTEPDFVEKERVFAVILYK